jgi:hypothetical protein
LLHPERLFALNEDKWVQIQAPILARLAAAQAALGKGPAGEA